MSQSPLIGAFVPGKTYLVKVNLPSGSQSPLIGAFVPGHYCDTVIYKQNITSQSPLIGAFVPGFVR